MPKFAFILSSGRTGTKFLAEFFNANYTNVLARHEPRPSYPLRMLSNAYAAGKVSRPALIAALRISRPILQRSRGDLYLESNPYLYGFVDALDEAINRQWRSTGKVIVIHIVRDPRTYVASAINHGGSVGIKAAATRLIPHWFPPVRRAQGVSARPTPVEMFAGEWALVNQFVGERGRPQPGYHLLRYEDIFDEANSGLRRMCEIFGLGYPGETAPISAQEKINPARMNVIGPWDTWTEPDRAALMRICGRLMATFGYEEAPGWRA
jgi:hypothetical protein